MPSIENLAHITIHMPRIMRANNSKRISTFIILTIEVLKKVKPKLIISAIRGPFEDQIDLHQQLVEHCKYHDCRLMFLSSSNVYDAFHNYPSYEFDKTLSESVYGRLKIKIENTIMRLSPSKYVIARLPMVFGLHSPRIKEMQENYQSK